MKAEELQGKTPDQLHQLVVERKKELFNLRFQTVTGEVTNTARFREVRRDIARIKTALNAPKSEAKAAKPAKAKPAKKAKAAKE